MPHRYEDLLGIITGGIFTGFLVGFDAGLEVNFSRGLIVHIYDNRGVVVLGFLIVAQ